ncbi:helix-turn-helix transcriptional regulator [Algoriphagus sp. H41]|uniref:Helix-turn-helix transcriptional regulator n=1 Tax=Algoriphagus oliviformis TaxID=2811231 RepID=A0ABS3C7L0_9BACT|nr:helix-turn-helix transcriptional regulator [Algoriphagus oliviformis]MBN7813088.1 helix-turn-helix transcriptional regulator [Algoriphagus oliviformis]
MSEAKKDRKQIHLGHNIQRIREIVGIKQYALAEACDWSQQQMSKLENSEYIDDSTLETIAEKLGVTPEFIKNFDDEKAVYNIQTNNTFNDHAVNSSQHNRPNIQYYPVDQIVKLLEKFIADDKQKSAQIESLTNTVKELAEEVKRMKSK